MYVDVVTEHPPNGKVIVTAVAALGIVFGDIGTSPLYTLQLAAERGQPTPADTLGVLSLIFWGLTLVVSIKYLAFIMRADNRGEGGILALLALIPEQGHPGEPHGPSKLTVITLLVIAGAALLFGDGIITPAISVLSAIEGLAVAAPDLFPRGVIIVITVLILVGLFAIQHKGTGEVGRFFGPVMVVWFVTIGVLGAIQIAQHPGILEAISPVYAVRYFTTHGLEGFPILGVVVLCLTGGEALYADMGHFGRRPIRVAWFTLAFPALVLCYFGQGALMLHDPSALANPFFALVPHGVVTYLLVALATFATIIASQALISGVFSLVHQAIQLGLFPRVEIRHTSAEVEGQIYVPAANWGLAIACVVLVIGFQESTRLAAAYGIAVSGTMAITSLAYYVVTRRTWGWPRWKAAPLLVLFLSFDLPFFAANLLKFLDGGYVPVLVGAVFFAMMLIWKIGRRALVSYMRERAAPVEKLLATLQGRLSARVPGTAVFLSPTAGYVPMILEQHIKRIKVLHEQVVLLTIVFEHVPTVRGDDRIEVTRHEQGFTSVTARFGYMDKPDVPKVLARAQKKFELPIELHEATYYLGRETLLGTSKGQLGPIRENLFAFLARNAASATSYFQLPADHVIELGTQIDL